MTGSQQNPYQMQSPLNAKWHISSTLSAKPTRTNISRMHKRAYTVHPNRKATLFSAQHSASSCADCRDAQKTTESILAKLHNDLNHSADHQLTHYCWLNYKFTWPVFPLRQQFHCSDPGNTFDWFSSFTLQRTESPITRVCSWCLLSNEENNFNCGQADCSATIPLQLPSLFPNCAGWFAREQLMVAYLPLPSPS